MANSKNGKGVGIGAGIAAAAAAAGAGYYFYFSKDAARHRRVAAKWASDLKRDVIRQARNVRDLEQHAVEAIVDKAAAAYRGVKAIDADHLLTAVTELKDNWQELRGELSQAARKSKTVARRAAGKVRSSATKAKQSLGKAKRATS